MDDRAAKLALARKKLKDHQQKKLICEQSDDRPVPEHFNQYENLNNESCIKENLQNIENNQHINISETVKTSSLSSRDTNFNLSESTEDIQNPESDVNITEILISNKRKLECQVNDLQIKLGQLEQNHSLVINNFKVCNHRVNELENELQNINDKYINVSKEILLKDSKLNELTSVNLSLSEEKNNLAEQLEFTKTVLNAKEAENDSIHNQLFNLQNQYDVIYLQLQQLTNGSPASPQSEKSQSSVKIEAILQKNSNLEHQLNLLQKERDQINLHYEHYVAELNEQLRSVVNKNEELSREVEYLSNRENGLIEQISDMEIRIQNYNLDKKSTEEDCNASTSKNLDDSKGLQNELNELQSKYDELKNQYAETVAKVIELSEVKQAECNHDNISLSKLNADMTSDKVAAQRATEQNKKLKQDLQQLEDAFVKMSKDKLELTEKISAEKFLNRELTIKLSEIEEKSKDMQIKLKAKDEEMMRLQSKYREIEKEFEILMNLGKHENTVSVIGPNLEINNYVVEESDKYSETGDKYSEVVDESSHSLQRADAMTKLQERFLKIMSEVAELSDEKHRLEHIILQLQNETDTICEYVALYQQQRSLLKRRDEERNAQLKVFQQECGKLKCELEELGEILKKFAEDKELSFYFERESKRIDMENVMTLLSNLKNNSLIDINKKNAEFKNFYPCNCCSGKLIDV